MKILVLSSFIFLGFLQSAYGQDILFSTNQTEYYFKIGENAMIPIEINNTYGKQISGILQYTITQQINQGNLQLSNYNTETKSLVINEKNTKISLGIGTSDTPSTATVNLNYNYNEKGDRIVSLGPITIHFIEDNSQKNNQQQNKMQSSSQPNTQPQQQDLFSQQEKQMEQRLNELFGSQQNSPQNQQQLQNNQLDQDSHALKQQFQKQLQKQEQIKKEFEKKLLSNNDFLKRHQKLVNNGYNVTNNILNANSNDTGSFEIKYNNTDGKGATLQGNMKNGAITDINQQTQDKKEKLLEKLKQNTLFQQFHNKLITEGFSQNDINFQDNGNETDIFIQYGNQKQEKAKIIANFENEEIKRITLENENYDSLNLMLLTIAVVCVISAVFVYFVIKKFMNKKRFTNDDSYLIGEIKSFDHVIESKKLIDQAQQYYDEGKYKDAFGTAGKAIRLFLRYDSGIKRETTSEELLRLIQKNNYPIDDIRECLKITDMIEFAKSKTSEDDFKKIITLFNNLSNQQNVK